MLKALMFGLGAGAAVQAWRAWPATSVVQGDSLALVFVLGLVVAFFAGKSRRPSGAVAVASAEATATAVNSNTVQLLIAPGHGASPAGVRVPTETAPWIEGPRSPELDVSSLEGMDLSEVLEHADHQTDDGW